MALRPVSGIRLEISVADGGLGAALRRGIALGQQPRDLMEAGAQIIEASTKARFETGTGPDGIAWKPSQRQARGVEKRRRKGTPKPAHKTLVDTGALLRSIRSEVGDDTATVGADGTATSSKYAATHQFGATILPKKGEFLVFTGPDGGLVFARSVTIPARPFMGVDAQDRADLIEAFTGVLETAFRPGD